MGFRERFGTSRILGKWNFEEVVFFQDMKFGNSGFGETVILEKVGFWYIGILQVWDFVKVGF